MNKNMIALAVATFAAAPAFAAEFQPTADTKFEVNVEVGAYYLSLKDKNGATTKELTGKGINQIEIKAEHKIDNDISVFGEIELDYDPVIDNDFALSDDTRIGINSKTFGRFTVGQFDSYFEDNLLEILGVGHGEKGFVSEPTSGNDGRHVQWVKSFGDFTFALDLTHSVNSDKTKTDLANSVSLMYKLGDLTVGVGRGQVSKYGSSATQSLYVASSSGGSATTAATVGALSTKDATIKEVTALAAKYKLGDLSLMGLYADEKKLSSGNIKYTGGALSYKMGQFDVGVALQQVKETGEANRSEAMIGFGYQPFKGTTFYVDAFKLDKAKKAGDGVEVGLKYAF